MNRDNYDNYIYRDIVGIVNGYHMSCTCRGRFIRVIYRGRCALHSDIVSKKWTISIVLLPNDIFPNQSGGEGEQSGI